MVYLIVMKVLLMKINRVRQEVMFRDFTGSAGAPRQRDNFLPFLLRVFGFVVTRSVPLMTHMYVLERDQYLVKYG